MNEAVIRLSDAEREAAAVDLAEHFAQGRLTADEHAERIERVWLAKTRGEVGPIFRDLPSPYAAMGAAPGPAAAWAGSWSPGLRRSRRALPAAVYAVLAVLVVAAVVTHLPLVLLGLGVWWFVAARHRGPRANHVHQLHGRQPQWR